MQLMSDEEENSDGEDPQQDGLLDGDGSDLPSSSAAESDDEDDSGELLCFHSCVWSLYCVKACSDQGCVEACRGQACVKA